MIEDGGWVIVAAAFALMLLIVRQERSLARQFTKLQVRLHGYDKELRVFLESLDGEPDRMERVNRVRRLDSRLPIVVAIVLVGLNLILAELFDTTHIVSRLALGVGIAVGLAGVLADYAENILLGRMIDTRPRPPTVDEIRLASRSTIFKCWAYIAATVIVLLQATVYLCLKVL